MQTIKDTLYGYFKSRTDKPISDEDNLFNAGLLDSMGVLELVYHLESNLRIEVDPDEISESNFKSIHAITTLAEGKLL